MTPSILIEKVIKKKESMTLDNITIIFFTNKELINLVYQGKNLQVSID